MINLRNKVCSRIKHDWEVFCLFHAMSVVVKDRKRKDLEAKKVDSGERYCVIIERTRSHSFSKRAPVYNKKKCL